MPEPTLGVDWEVNVKRRVEKIEVDATSLEVTLSSIHPPEIIKSGKITKVDFEKIKNVVKKVLEAQ